MKHLPVYVIMEGRSLMIGSQFPVKNWLDVCHQRPFIAISYDPDYRGEDCPRPWKIRLHTNWFSDTKARFKTLKNAEKGAKSWAKQGLGR